jgi:2-keto-4-pentenoate hydratase/2-oxohepta-3-ene-1,7-dioic acid hydratase in catechol pathway
MRLYTYEHDGRPRVGVGFFRNPERFLNPGDVCVLEIDGIGRLENLVEAIR